MGNYRNRLDIVADILHIVAGGGIKKTQIMYGANLSYRLLMKYLADVRKSSLVSFQRKERCYVLTPKGKSFLEMYREYSKHSKFVERHIVDVNAKRKVLETLCSNP